MHQRMYDLHIALQCDESGTDDRRIQSDPDEVLTRNELAEEIAPPINKVVVL